MTYDTTLMVFRSPVNSPVEEKVVYPIIYVVSKTSQAGNRWFNLTPEMGWKTLLQKMWGS